MQESCLRLHVIAASDSAHDQRQKEQVKQAVLPVLAHRGKGLKGLAQCEGLILEAARQAGYEGPLRLYTGWFPFERRQLGSKTFPAGVYPAGLVVLGEGKGHNWWGLLNPSLTQAACGGGSEWIWHLPAIFSHWFAWPY